MDGFAFAEGVTNRSVASQVWAKQEEVC